MLTLAESQDVVVPTYCFYLYNLSVGSSFIIKDEGEGSGHGI